MNKHILVPLDGSDMAEMVLPHAVCLARATSSALILLRAAPLPNLAMPMGGGIVASSELWHKADDEPELARMYLANVVDRLHSEVGEGLVAETVVPDGEAAWSIVHYADQHPEVNLIALATHGRSGLGRWIFGSVAERVLQSSPVPLLLVHPEHGSDQAHETLSPEYRKILVPLDGSPFAEYALEQAVKVASNWGAGLLLMTVEHLPQTPAGGGSAHAARWLAASPERSSAMDYLAGVAAKLQHMHGAQLPIETYVSHGEPAHEILKTIAESGVDMVVMSTHGRSGLQRLWLGSVALKVVRGTSLPVLLVRAKERIAVPEAHTSAVALAT